MKFIYALIDPRSMDVRYIGQTGNLEKRLKQHTEKDDGTEKFLWISDLLKAGFSPIMITLEEVHDCDATKSEYEWIYIGRVKVWRLTNTVAMKTKRYTDSVKLVKDLVQDEIRSDAIGESEFVNASSASCTVAVRILVFVICIYYAMYLGFGDMGTVSRNLVFLFLAFALIWASEFYYFLIKQFRLKRKVGKRWSDH